MYHDSLVKVWFYHVLLAVLGARGTGKLYFLLT